MTTDVTIQNAINSQNQTNGAGASLAGDFDDFLNLLTVQLQNQDPLSPMDSTEFTNQLVQFSTVEQQINTNQRLDSLVALQLSNALSSSQSFVGNDISYVSSEFAFDGSPNNIRYSLPKTSVDTTIRIFNEDGGLVYEEEVSGDVGASDFVWDGRLIGGGIAQNGTYEVSVDALDSDGQAVQATTVVTGRVTGVESQNGQIFLIVGERAVAQANVLNTSISSDAVNNTDGLTSALDYIGLDVSYDNDSLVLQSGQSATINYSLPEAVERASITIFNDLGEVVATEPVSGQAGTNSFVWDGAGQSSGEYRYEINAITQRQTVVRSNDVSFDGTTDIPIDYVLPSSADEVRITVQDVFGNVVHTDTGDRDSGANIYTWEPSAGTPAGDYTITVTNVDDEDTRVPVASTATSRVTGIESDNGVIFLQISPTRSIPLSEILSATLPPETAGV